MFLSAYLIFILLVDKRCYWREHPHSWRIYASSFLATSSDWLAINQFQFQIPGREFDWFIVSDDYVRSTWL